MPNGKTGIVRKAERGMCTVEVEGTGDKVVEKKSDLQLVPEGEKSPEDKQAKLMTDDPKVGSLYMLHVLYII